MSLATKGPHPLRGQIRRTKGWRKPEGAVYVCRPTKWGNPFVAKNNDDDRRFAVEQFELYQLPRLDVLELKGKILMCWCPVGSPCHADVLAWAANGVDYAT